MYQNQIITNSLCKRQSIYKKGLKPYASSKSMFFLLDVLLVCFGIFNLLSVTKLFFVFLFCFSLCSSELVCRTCQKKYKLNQHISCINIYIYNDHAMQFKLIITSRLLK